MESKHLVLLKFPIVVAIIAVLVAIAVPLFVGSLKDAQEATKNANIHSVRSTAVVKILNTKESEDTQHKVYQASNKGLYAYYQITATVDATGNITSIAIEGKEAKEDAFVEDAVKQADGTYQVTAGITNTDILSGVKPAT